ncbi:hypothetical protein AB870_24355 (plasmid) [Pandoraea faecigallinarum]|uniref:Response regulatory domain-containing protein n=1 Tax=Pandoraea faecigallinarum TaxID=656179 RepID=A0A0H3WYW2_9BURK|nr:response regulator transcription factor [Pandoraea faecigallinarum]AKM33329.1 hypothetical protein AB870_24355 [Pandoraea faecigallinarum]
MPNASIRIAIADNHPVVLVGLAQELRALQDVEVAVMAQSSDELIRQLNERPCTVVLTDDTLPDPQAKCGGGLLALLRASYAAATVVVLTMADHPEVIHALREQGVAHIVSKSDATVHIARAVEAARTGRPYLSPKITKIIDESGRAAA